ncbi:MAG: tetratricopeptide repeat protein, partial [Pseudomonadales bacterium]|nr:tetratricopeptide repeat protein [Pseudomonadales bacterium]
RAKTTAALAVERFPKSSLTHYMVAQADASLGDNDAARVSIEKSLQIFPAYIPSRLLLARIMIETGEHAEAGKIIDRLQKDLPDDENVLLLKAQHQTAIGNHGKASHLYQGIYESKPDSRSISDLAWSNYFDGNTKVAENLLKEWLQQHPADIQVRFSLIQVYKGMGRVDEATSQLEVVLELHGDNAFVLNELAWQLYGGKQFKQAHIIAQKAYQKSPGSPAIRDTYGLTLLETGQLEQALKVLGAVSADYPDNSAFHFHYAQALLRAGRTELGVTQLEKALTLSTNRQEKKEILALLNSM